VAKPADKPPVVVRPSRRQCLRAVFSRDLRMDGRFVYAVRSTGVYCRPSCPSRRPHPTQLLFFAAPQAAESAGFRPCLRCRPQDAGGSPRSELVRRMCREIEAHKGHPAGLRKLAAFAGQSAGHLQRSFRRALGLTPRQYADTIRVARLKSQLKGGTNVTNALYEAGYGSASRLYERAGAQLGMTPATYLRGGRGMKITYAVAKCSLGRVLVGVTVRGICAVYLGENAAQLTAALVKEYPHAEIRHSSGKQSQWVRAIVRHIEGAKLRPDLPTDVTATAFQRRVWEALRSIPPGTTQTYGDVARSLGRPGAARAVARACATNPASLVIPCHRVVRADGSLGGYRWGLQRKKILLERERQGVKDTARSRKQRIEPR
jgi:AraC family transcriptional regulator of adaptative response/methylated-DNA-[protein]-cysteine methyltransferase